MNSFGVIHLLFATVRSKSGVQDEQKIWHNSDEALKNDAMLSKYYHDMNQILNFRNLEY